MLVTRENYLKIRNAGTYVKATNPEKPWMDFGELESITGDGKITVRWQAGKWYAYSNRCVSYHEFGEIETI